MTPGEGVTKRRGGLLDHKHLVRAGDGVAGVEHLIWRFERRSMVERRDVLPVRDVVVGVGGVGGWRVDELRTEGDEVVQRLP